MRVGQSFDLIKKRLTLDSGGYAVLYYIDGFVKDEISEKLMEYYIKTPPEKLADTIPYVETENTDDTERMTTSILSGATLLLLPGQKGGTIIDTRSYPVRGIEEPGNDRVLRGPRDGFCETIIFNTALIRRRIRDRICLPMPATTQITETLTAAGSWILLSTLFIIAMARTLWLLL